MNDMSQIFAALGEPTRFAIVDRLLKEGDCYVGQLLDLADISPPAMTRHLKVLTDAGLVERRAERQRRIYSIRKEAFATLSEWMISHQAFWDGSLDRLERALAEDKK